MTNKEIDSGKIVPEEPKAPEKVFMDAFNARTQQVESHLVTTDRNGEFVFTAEDGSFFKLPAHLEADEIVEHLKKHEEANVGQVSNEQAEKANALQFAKLLDAKKLQETK